MNRWGFLAACFLIVAVVFTGFSYALLNRLSSESIAILSVLVVVMPCGSLTMFGLGLVFAVMAWRSNSRPQIDPAVLAMLAGQGYHLPAPPQTGQYFPPPAAQRRLPARSRRARRVALARAGVVSQPQEVVRYRNVYDYDPDLDDETPDPWAGTDIFRG